MNEQTCGSETCDLYISIYICIVFIFYANFTFGCNPDF